MTKSCSKPIRLGRLCPGTSDDIHALTGSLPGCEHRRPLLVCSYRRSNPCDRRSNLLSPSSNSIRLRSARSSALVCGGTAVRNLFSADNGPGNLIFSPLSIHSALGLVAGGAHGRTLGELLGLLGAGSRKELDADVRSMVGLAFPEAPHKGGPHVSYACGVWHDSARALKPAYRDLAATSFRSAVRAVDFLTKPEEARTEINGWVAEATSDHIDTIPEPGSVNSSTSLVVANAIYFKGSWANRFDKPRTKEGKFHRLDGSVVDAQFMNSSGSRQCIEVHDGFKVLRMPYAAPPNPLGTTAAMAVGHIPRHVAPRYSMCILLLDENDGLQKLQDKVASNPGFLMDHMPYGQHRVGEFRVPKFKLSFATSVRKALRDLGVQAVFSAGAELPGMLEDDGSQEPQFLGDVFHKAVIEVNEEGTEAAAVTASLPSSPTIRSRFFVVEEVSAMTTQPAYVTPPRPLSASPVSRPPLLIAPYCSTLVRPLRPRIRYLFCRRRSSLTPRGTNATIAAADPAHMDSTLRMFIHQGTDRPIDSRFAMEKAAAAARKHASSAGLRTLSSRLMTELSSAAAKNRAPGCDRRKNLVFSPLSIYAALSLVAAGAKGRTLAELLRGLGATSRDRLVKKVRRVVDGAVPGAQQPGKPGTPRVGFASGIWHDSTRALKPAYRDVAATYCRAAARGVDFLGKPEEARKKMNRWVAKETNRLIKSIVPKGSINHNTRLAVTSALYFKGKWATPFHRFSTLTRKFRRLDGTAVDADLMRSLEDHQFIGVHDGFKVSRYSMVVLLPDADDGLWSLEDRVASSPGFLQEHLPFLVPRFKVSFTSGGMREALQSIGIEAMFSPRRAELPDILEEDDAGEPLFVGDVLHKAVMEVNEQGTEAAAATAILLIGSSGGPPDRRRRGVDFVADHPFVFFIVEEVSGAILFAGHVLDPTQSQ
ncbi:hypothetical protein HU200_029040 [Digitaria exilis]|uniref:Serpin domain-containing protein n=1 Tax=Digitaria exilis TaxID=1010633 RepID=A0A835C2K7_9POAL|nr:hypothetical protein HU200_029040 [Digitaria exilis]